MENTLNLLFESQAWLSLFTLTVLEIVLGIDNLLFLSLLSGKLPQSQQKSGRQIGLLLALLMRLILLSLASWIIHTTKPLLTLFNEVFSARDILLLTGGIFLLFKGTLEIHATVDDAATMSRQQTGAAKFSLIIIQIMLFDMIFSLDSIITAVGMTQEFVIMSAAIIIAIVAMMFASDPLAKLIERYPSIKMLALSFLILIAMVLIADGLHFYIPRGYLYFAIAFSLFVETLNILAGKRRKSHKLIRKIIC